MFYVGQKVVCIDDTNIPLTYGESAPTKGGHYTIRKIRHNGQSVLLVEVVNKPYHYIDFTTDEPVYCETGFKSSRFAPIEEYTDSMSIAMQLVQELDQVDKAKNPVKEGAKV